MKTMIRRLCKLEQVCAPLVNAEALAQALAIRESRQRRLGANGEHAEDWPMESFAGCQTMADVLRRARALSLQGVSRGDRAGDR